LKNRVVQIALTALLAALYAGCGASRPYRYYTLDVAHAPSPPSGSDLYPIKLLVGRVSTPELYRDNRIVYGSGEFQLGAFEYERWAEMPAEMIQDALVAALRTTGQYRSVTRFGSSARGDYVIRSQLFSLYEVDRPSLVARFAMQFELYDPKSGATVWTTTYSHDEPVQGKSVADVVEAMNRNVRAGVQQAVGGLGQYFAAHPPETPQAPATK
jgi:ABC-type uncharacterized transport system auxiliary subunit